MPNEPKDPRLSAQASVAIGRGIPEDELFTPILDGERVVMRVKHFPWTGTSGPDGAYLGVITDDLTGSKYRVYAKDCGLPHCCCDAEVKPLLVVKTKNVPLPPNTP